jgi:DNA-binding MarR family transcriptional regulator
MKRSAVAHLRSLDHTSSSNESVVGALQAVRALVEALSQSARTIESKTGVSNAQLFLLQQIAAESGLSVNALAARAMTHQSTVSIVLSRLERRGLVERVDSAVDRRSVILRLTPAGRRLLRKAPAPATSEMLEALERLTAEELRALRRGIGALGRELGFSSDRPAMLFESSGRLRRASRPGDPERPPRKGRRTPRR